MYFFMQFFMFTKNYEFWHDEVCLDLVDGNPNTKVKLYTCHGLGGNQKWEHEKASAKYYKSIIEWMIFGFNCNFIRSTRKRVSRSVSNLIWCFCRISTERF